MVMSATAGYSEWDSSCVLCNSVDWGLIAALLAVGLLYALVLTQVSKSSDRGLTKIFVFFGISQLSWCRLPFTHAVVSANGDFHAGTSERFAVSTLNSLIVAVSVWLSWMSVFNFDSSSASSSRCVAPITPLQKASVLRL